MMVLRSVAAIALIIAFTVDCRKAARSGNVDASVGGSPALAHVRSASSARTDGGGSGTSAAKDLLHVAPSDFSWKRIEYAPYVAKTCGEMTTDNGLGLTAKDCSFALDVPTFLQKVPYQSTDGRCFAGAGVQMSVWMYPSYYFTTMRDCTRYDGATLFKKSKHSCLQSGTTRTGTIYWQRVVFTGDSMYALCFEYPAANKRDMDAVVERVNTSWHRPINALEQEAAGDSHDDYDAGPANFDSVLNADPMLITKDPSPFECPIP